VTDTIFALSSGQPPAAIGVVRISGPQAFAAVESLAGKLPSPRRATLRTLSTDATHLDRALVLIFPGPTTVTGEDLAELHLHGGRAVVRAVEAALAAMSGLRAAEAGEFTRRALANGRIDLTEAEGLGDLLAAETEAQRRAAIRAAEGGIRQRIEGWASRTLQLSAIVEAMLDHADEDDVAAEAGPLGRIGDDARALEAEIETVLAQPGVERLRDGIRVVLAGPPNAGKSTLLNALAEREAAIVSPLAGTTRDRIEAPVMRDGIAYRYRRPSRCAVGYGRGDRHCARTGSIGSGGLGPVARRGATISIGGSPYPDPPARGRRGTRRRACGAVARLCTDRRGSGAAMGPDRGGGAGDVAGK
jgi:tRNA modification GTPase